MKKVLLTALMSASVLLTGCANQNFQLSKEMTGVIGAVGGAVIGHQIDKKIGNGENTYQTALAIGGGALGYYYGFKRDEAIALQSQLNQMSNINAQLVEDNQNIYLKSQVDMVKIVKMPKNIINKKMLDDLSKACNITASKGGVTTVIMNDKFEWMRQSLPQQCQLEFKKEQSQKNMTVIYSKYSKTSK